jgi:lysozyme
MVSKFADISGFQSDVDWQAYRKWAAQWDGISRVAIKATEGVGFKDPSFDSHRAGALAAGVDVLILYHYARPDLGNSPEAEANWFCSVVGKIRENDRLALDIETNAAVNMADWCVRFLDHVRALDGRVPVVYSYYGFISSYLQDERLLAAPLWLACWTYSVPDVDTLPKSPYPWSGYQWLQYSDRASIPGIAGPVDANVCIGGTTLNGTVYGPQSADFAHWFTANDGNHWTCKQTGAIIRYANLDFYRKLSMDGNSLPMPGLPLESEQEHTDADGYKWSEQQFERATMRYDPEHRKDSQPGAGGSYLAHVNPPKTIIVEKLPDAILADIQALKAASDKLAKDAQI